jgi:divinyl protochlorophyllide a 8-vinyl-reductase
MPEAPAAALHQAVRAHLPDRHQDIAREAGIRTADYVIANRIPKLIVWLLPKLPHRLAARLLTNSIQKHAWTFTGSGRFNVLGVNPVRLQIADNPVVRGEEADTPLCHWHAAVFSRLYQRLVRADYVAHETECCANHHPACRFEISPAT